MAGSTTRLRGSARARPRRSHAERTAATRERVMAAVVASMAEVGYRKTTTTEIARRAGVTWGAVQHHFGDKDGILAAVLADTFARFAERLGDPPAGAGLGVRVGRFVDRAWEHFASPHYRTTFEILRHVPPDADRAWQGQMLAAWSRIWTQWFPGGRLGRQQRLGLMQYTIAVLAGLAAVQMLSGRRAGRRETELEFLKDTLRRALAPGGARTMHDVVIRGGRIVDGTRSPPVAGDVAIDGGVTIPGARSAWPTASPPCRGRRSSSAWPAG